MHLDKHSIRQSLRSHRTTLDSLSREKKALAVATQITQMTSFKNCQHIGGYLTHNGELDPAPIIKTAFETNKKLYLPVLKKKSHAFSYYPYYSNESLIENRYGIGEPTIADRKPISTTCIDVVLVPLVAFDENCHRLGRGVGYYDRTFAFICENPAEKRPLLVGLAYEFQKIKTVHPEPWDIPMDMIVTEEKVYE